jgi:nucleotide-binding universal stress UspA family protein
MKKILIALDYDTTAQKVAEIGFSLGQNQQAEITLLHVTVNPSYYASSVYNPVMGFGGFTNLDLLAPDMIDALKKTSLHFLEKTKLHLGDDKINILVKEGSTAELILETAKELNADIIVIGSHSKSWLENTLMGSVTEHVLHHAAIPLFIIPTKKHG